MEFFYLCLVILFMWSLMAIIFVKDKCNNYHLDSKAQGSFFEEWDH